MVGKAGDQALRRSAFQEAITHLDKAIQMADKAEGGMPAEPPANDTRERICRPLTATPCFTRKGMPRWRRAPLSIGRASLRPAPKTRPKILAYYGVWSGRLSARS